MKYVGAKMDLFKSAINDKQRSQQIIYAYIRASNKRSTLHASIYTQYIYIISKHKSKINTFITFLTWLHDVMIIK